MSTFKEPWLKRVTEALDGAVSITWEGCHKLYICMDKESHDQQIEFGYDMIEVSQLEHVGGAADQLFEWFDNSCGLRFISAISNGDSFDRVIPQFEYDDEE
tara:strand:+ start:299 stop:601 length:303 start_codon:yes stop_codon:yes gene_type:complete